MMKHAALSALRALMSPIVPRPDYLQVAALCLRDGRDGAEVLLVSSLTTKRWILPKGWPMEGRSLAEAARQEAWEEAGVSGTVEPAPVGQFSYRKLVKRGVPITCRCEVFRVRVESLAERYPEHARRQRRWTPLAEAVADIDEPELRALLAAI